MRIAVTGEGPTDYGKVDYGNPGHWIDGPSPVTAILIFYPLNFVLKILSLILR